MKHNFLLVCCSILLITSTGRLSAQQAAFRSLATYFPVRLAPARSFIYSYRGPDSVQTALVKAYVKAFRPFGGLYNTATGTGALYNITGNGNVADGVSAMQNSTSANANVAVGFTALAQLTTGNNNTAVGNSAGIGCFTGSNNTLIGSGSGEGYNFGSNNVALGYSTMIYDQGNNNTAVGTTAFQGTSSSSESNSTALGYSSMYESNSSNGYNTAMGAYALYGNPNTGSDNLVSGAYSMYSNTSGSYNATGGAYSLYANTSGSENAASGAYALYENTTGIYNAANGYLAMYQNTSGSYNLADGVYAMYNNTTGSDNTGVGGFATVGSGGLSNATALGYGSYASSSNSVMVGNSSVTSIGGSVGWTNFSDGRYKKNIQQNVPGLAFINKLTPITYTLDVDGIEAKLHADDRSPSIKGIETKPNYLDDPVVKQAMKEKSAITYTGFVAQDVEKAADSVGFAFSGIDKPKDASQSFYGLRYGDFVVPLVKSVQELSAKSDSKDSVINAMQVATQAKFDSLQSQINELRALLLAKNTSAMSGASLDQNAPNPFTGSTTIGYSLPKGISSAKLQITDVNGNVLAIVPLSGSGGKSTVTASLSGYAAGTYMYSLIVNGKLVGTRQMIAVR